MTTRRRRLAKTRRLKKRRTQRKASPVATGTSVAAPPAAPPGPKDAGRAPAPGGPVMSGDADGHVGPRGAVGPSEPEPPAVRDTVVERIEACALPVVTELDRLARGPERPRVKLETALRQLFALYAGEEREFSRLMLEGWLRARQDKQSRLRLAWQREQIRLSLCEILAEGCVEGSFRPGLDAGAVAAIMLGTAEGTLLQAATEGGPVAPPELVETLLGLAISAA